MFTIANYVADGFDGMLVVGDIHGDIESFMAAKEYAVKNNYFFMLLGDAVDRGRNPYEVVSEIHAMMQDGRAGFTVGNHDDKHYRYSLGNKVSLSADGKRTIDDVGPERLAEFHRMYGEVINDVVLSGVYHKFGDIVLAHAASHPCLWEGDTVVTKSARARFLVGETNGEVDSTGYPVRLYNWINEVPIGKTMIVGHDRMPIHDVAITEPLLKTNASGGKAIFMDTGCGKGGFLTGALILCKKGNFYIDEYVEFKK